MMKNTPPIPTRELPAARDLQPLDESTRSMGAPRQKQQESGKKARIDLDRRNTSCVHVIRTPSELIELLLKGNSGANQERIEAAITSILGKSILNNYRGEVFYYPPDIACVSEIDRDFYDTSTENILREKNPDAFIARLTVEARVKLLINLRGAADSSKYTEKLKKDDRLLIERLINYLILEYECENHEPQKICDELEELNIDRAKREIAIKEKLGGMSYYERSEFMTRLDLQRDEIETDSSIPARKMSDIIGHINYVYRRFFMNNQALCVDSKKILDIVDPNRIEMSFELLRSELFKWDIKSRLILYSMIKKQSEDSTQSDNYGDKSWSEVNKTAIFIDFFENEYEEYDTFVSNLSSVRRKIAQVFWQAGQEMWLSEQGLNELVMSHGNKRIVTSWLRISNRPDMASKYSKSPSSFIPAIRHKNIIPEEIYPTTDGGSVCIAPYRPNMIVLEKLMDALTIEEKLNFFADAMDGSIYMHEYHGLVHCDIKPSNMTILEHGGQKWCALFDLEGAYYRERSRNHPSIDIRTTPYYSETHYLGIPFCCFIIDRHSDTFSYGICLAEAYTGKEAVREFAKNRNLGLKDVFKGYLLKKFADSSSKMPALNDRPEGSYLRFHSSETAFYADGSLFIEYLIDRLPLNMNDNSYRNTANKMIRGFCLEIGIYDEKGMLVNNDRNFESVVVDHFNKELIYFIDYFMRRGHEQSDSRSDIQYKTNIANFDRLIDEFNENWLREIEENLFADHQIPEEMKTLIKRMLNAVPNERISLFDALQIVRSIL